MTAKTIEYFYSAHSAFAYLGSKRVMEIAAAAGRKLLHKPVHLGPVVSAVGGKTFAERTPQHVAYFFGREIERWAEFRNVPVIDFRPTYHDEDMTLASCMLIAAQDQGLDADRLAHLILEVHWRDDADISDPSLLRNLAASLDIDPDSLIESAQTPAVQKTYQANTAEAIARSVFGSPTYFIDGDMHYGQDHLELIERALAG
ncbi:2-hydroxychromene-2-carboxylate isomerase [Denitrobaculum tricleocarpae]|uniref:2-hydroxychromene-2-carboxylate isomerase n=1 Tax=Denitrobaculum tricleocarpae TaxID=2591009 RepID=A0A545TTF8_9PROT|nr:2-hydroxychromene-2-carboxylate isomerase [Denitrobaculum tricleocarpae]TQV80500.1 2-hydroxychromene-2-carboxylate isomerase [Denitrobaculum tricleocarpae]